MEVNTFTFFSHKKGHFRGGQDLFGSLQLLAIERHLSGDAVHTVLWQHQRMFPVRSSNKFAVVANSTERQAVQGRHQAKAI